MPKEGKNTPEQVGGQDKNKNYEQTLTLYSIGIDHLTIIIRYFSHKTTALDNNKSLMIKYYSKLIIYILINNIYIRFYDSFEIFVAFEKKLYHEW